jgi:hypothetical protein
MHVKILKVHPGSYYMGCIYDFWIYAQLRSGAIIRIFDTDYDLREKEGEEIEVLLRAFYAHESNGNKIQNFHQQSGPYSLTTSFSGTLRKSIQVSPVLEFRNMNDASMLNNYIFFEMDDGEFLLTPETRHVYINHELTDIIFSTRIGEHISISTGRLDLIGSEFVGTRRWMIYDTPAKIFEQVKLGFDNIRSSSPLVHPSLTKVESTFELMKLHYYLSSTISPEIINQFGKELHDVYVECNYTVSAAVNEMQGLIQAYFYQERSEIEWRPTIRHPEDDMAR